MAATVEPLYATDIFKSPSSAAKWELKHKEMSMKTPKKAANMQKH